MTQKTYRKKTIYCVFFGPNQLPWRYKGTRPRCAARANHVEHFCDWDCVPVEGQVVEPILKGCQIIDLSNRCWHREIQRGKKLNFRVSVDVEYGRKQFVCDDLSMTRAGVLWVGINGYEVVDDFVKHCLLKFWRLVTSVSHCRSSNMSVTLLVLWYLLQEKRASPPCVSVPFGESSRWYSSILGWILQGQSRL